MALPVNLLLITALTILSGFYYAGVGVESAIKAEQSRQETARYYELNRPTLVRAQLMRALRLRTPHLSLRQRGEMAEAIAYSALINGHDPFLILAVIETESSYRTTAVSNKGAVGLMQLRPFVARAIAAEIGPSAMRGQLVEPRTNIRLGSYYLAKLLRRFDGDLTLALEAYNRGPTRLEEHLAQGVILGKKYTSKVLKARERLKKLARSV
jgi:soluble lytic murein transglycosylase